MQTDPMQRSLLSSLFGEFGLQVSQVLKRQSGEQLWTFLYNIQVFNRKTNARITSQHCIDLRPDER